MPCPELFCIYTLKLRDWMRLEAVIKKRHWIAHHVLIKPICGVTDVLISFFSKVHAKKIIPATERCNMMNFNSLLCLPLCARLTPACAAVSSMVALSLRKDEEAIMLWRNYPTRLSVSGCFLHAEEMRHSSALLQPQEIFQSCWEQLLPAEGQHCWCCTADWSKRSQVGKLALTDWSVLDHKEQTKGRCRLKSSFITYKI